MWSLVLWLANAVIVANPRLQFARWEGMMSLLCQGVLRGCMTLRPPTSTGPQKGLSGHVWEAAPARRWPAR